MAIAGPRRRISRTSGCAPYPHDDRARPSQLLIGGDVRWPLAAIAEAPPLRGAPTHPAWLADRDACYRAIAGRDARWDGRLFYGVSATGIFCRPSCPSRTPKPEHAASSRRRPRRTRRAFAAASAGGPTRRPARSGGTCEATSRRAPSASSARGCSTRAGDRPVVGSLDELAATVTAVLNAGAVGINIEDSGGGPALQPRCAG
ncbi:MAG: Ada metal-binding domain-containing protein [Solirubrobacteraceae bacterium]